MKSLKLFIFLTTVILVFNTNISYGRENKNSNQTTHIITVNKDNLLTVIQDNELEKNKSIDKNSSSTDNDSKHEPKVLKDNTITIPNVCNNAKITIGSKQHDVNKYDICLMTEAAAFFGQEQPILLGGHNTKSLKYLYKSKIGDIIIINYSGSYYQYKVVYSSECTTDNYNLFDIDNGKNVLEYRTGKEVLQIYTCYGSNNRWFVKAVRI
ncbi:sortase domain-containing protein [Thomasclavelia cocleata]|uniref:sortase domain-containing protein n=2 Tax=Thomasclavelia cocleata TaxID=69824 RepID=UPI0025582DA7|nr:sortase [Thomasclavelia cocleata]